MGDVLGLVSVFEHNLPLIVVALNFKLCVLGGLSVKDSKRWVVVFFDLLDLNKRNLIWHKISINVQLIVTKLTIRDIIVNLLKDVLRNILERSILPYLGCVPSSWQLDLGVLLVGLARLIVHDGDELILVPVFLEVHRAFKNSAVLTVRASLDMLVQF